MENEYQIPQEENQEACATETAEAPKSTKKFPIKLVIIAAAAVVAVLMALLVYGMATNTYKTPIKLMAKTMDSKAGDYMDETLDQLNGFTEKETRAILKIMKKSDDNNDELKDAQEDYENSIEELQDLYGKNFKLKYEITGKEKIDKDGLEDIEDSFGDMAEYFEDAVDETKDYDADDWERLAERSGLSKAQMKKLVKAMGKLGKTYKKAKVTAGYELQITWTYECGKDAEMDKDFQREQTICVYKVNGRWVCLNALSKALFF